MDPCDLKKYFLTIVYLFEKSINLVTTKTATRQFFRIYPVFSLEGEPSTPMVFPSRSPSEMSTFTRMRMSPWKKVLDKPV